MPRTLIIRPLRIEDAETALEVHRAAVRVTAAKDYPSEILEQWARLPIADKDIKSFLENPDGETRFVAELNGGIVGMAAIVPANHEVRACYVAPHAGGCGIGAALLRELEQEACRHGLTFLRLDSSLTAEAFYRVHGYEVRSRGEHILRTGQRMACVHMEKRFLPVASPTD